MKDIRDFGGIEGDPSRSACEANVEAIKKAAQDSDDNTVYLPEGEWYIGSSQSNDGRIFHVGTDAPAGMSFVGDGPTKSFLKWGEITPGENNRIQVNAADHSGMTWKNLTYDGNRMYFESNGADWSNENIWGMRMNGGITGSNVLFENVRFQHFPGNCINRRFQQNQDMTINRCTFYDIGVGVNQDKDKNQHPISGAGGNQTPLKITNCEFLVTSGFCVNSNGDDYFIENNYAEGFLAFHKLNGEPDIEERKLNLQGYSQEHADMVNYDPSPSWFTHFTGSETNQPEIEAHNILLQDCYGFGMRAPHAVKISGATDGPIAMDTVAQEPDNGIYTEALSGDDGNIGLTFDNLGQISIHNADNRILGLSASTGNIQTLHWDNAPSLGDKGDVTFENIVKGGEPFKPDVPSQSEVGINSGSSSSNQVSGIPSDAVDIRDYGAAVDGSTDDTEAVKQAIDEAASKNGTVFFPEGTTVVGRGEQRAIILESEHSGVTLKGNGENSIIKLAGGHSSDQNNQVIWIKGSSNPSDITVRDLKVDGNRSNNPDGKTQAINVWPSGNTSNILLENLWVANSAATGFQLSSSDITVRNCTARNCMKHGFNPTAPNPDRPIVLENVLAEENEIYGIDDSCGDSLIDGFVCRNNARGMKNTFETRKSEIRNGRLSQNEYWGYAMNIPPEKYPQERAEVTIDNVLAEENGSWGFRFAANADYRIGNIVAINNNASRQKVGQITVQDSSRILEADRIQSCNAADGSGLIYTSERNSQIANYVHSGNPGGALGGSSQENLSIAQNSSAQCERLDVPTASQVGAAQSLVEELASTGENNDQETSEDQVYRDQKFVSGEPKDSDSAIFGNKVTGIVNQSKSDEFYIYGELREFHAEEGVTVIYDGQEYTPEELQQQLPECKVNIISQNQSQTSQSQSQTSQSQSQTSQSGGNYSSSGVCSVGADSSKTGPEPAGQNVENVKADHGAAGDGSTNDRDAIRNAIDAAGPGGTVYIPEGTYMIDGTKGDSSQEEAFIIGSENAGVSFVGDGPERTVLKMEDDHDRNYIALKYVEGTDHSGATVRDLTFDGNGMNQPAGINGFGVSIRSGNQQDIRLKNCIIRNWYTNGGLFGSPGLKIEDCSFLDNGQATSQKNGYDGHGFNSSVSNGEIVAERCVFSGMSGTAIDCKGTPGTTVLRDSVVVDQNYGIKQNDGTGEMRCERVRFQNIDELCWYIIPGKTDIGTVNAIDCVFDGIDWGAFDFNSGGTIKGDKIIIRDAARTDRRGAFYARDSEVDINRLAIVDSNESAFALGDTSGTIQELYVQNNSGGRGNMSDVNAKSLRNSGPSWSSGAPVRKDNQWIIPDCKKDQNNSDTENAVDVREFGAEGDGSTDDTLAIIDAANEAAPDGTVYFPSGTYIVGRNSDNPLRYSEGNEWDDVTWEGESASNTAIKMAGGKSGYHMMFRAENVSNSGATFRNLEIDMNGENQSPTGNSGSSAIHFESGEGTIRIENCIIRDCLGGAVRITGDHDAEIHNSEFYNSGNDITDKAGHSLIYAPESSKTCNVSYCLFDGDLGGILKSGLEQGSEICTLNLEWCWARGPRLIKIDPENYLTTFNHVYFKAMPSPLFQHDGIATNINDERCGALVLKNSVLEGPMEGPGIGIGSASDIGNDSMRFLEIDNVDILNVSNERRNAGFFCESTEHRGGSIYISEVGPDNDKDAVNFYKRGDRGNRGSYEEIRYSDAGGIGNTGEVDIGNVVEGGNRFNPDVPRKEDVGIQSSNN